ncbi:hypothetical protein XMG59_000114 [Marinobacterium sp. xm-g-59]|uniref:YeeE/YedE family protein n=1 Tax=Marinobacterium sp. xm-g-59 TaxID=2497748 RepID=UPI001569D406|nr:YeeE/YedE family protein [Marinobacterium sp. xm-g-59]NRP94035.1 hypothetical protein [Marinobacterium sp. xm-g-59]
MNIKSLLVALISGTLFGLGLSVAQMIDPAKVVNFLDVTGQWDPSLAFVMAGALAVNIVATPLILKRNKPVCDTLFRTPLKEQIDRRLILGAALFGVGWGIAGYCPGPMITAVSFVNSDILIVLTAYVIGTLLTRLWMRKRKSHLSEQERQAQSCIE